MKTFAIDGWFNFDPKSSRYFILKLVSVIVFGVTHPYDGLLANKCFSGQCISKYDYLKTIYRKPHIFKTKIHSRDVGFYFYLIIYAFLYVYKRGHPFWPRFFLCFLPTDIAPIDCLNNQSFRGSVKVSCLRKKIC